MLLRNALWTIERNLHTGLPVATIAEACGVSRYHLSHAFATATGFPIMRYIRARRLSLAAEALTRTTDGIISIARDAGYASHEAFTRAFKAQFGMTPDALRQHPLATGLPLTLPLALPETASMTLEPPRFIEEPAKLVIGLSNRHAATGPERIPAQWSLFMTQYAGAIRHRLPGAPIAVCHNCDDEGQFDYVCAAPVARIDDMPDGLVAVRIPAQTYAVLTHRGHVTALPRTYAAMWNEWFPANPWRPVNTASLEKHLDSFDPRTGLGGVELWIPVGPTGA